MAARAARWKALEGSGGGSSSSSSKGQGAAHARAAAGGTGITCCTGTTVQILALPSSRRSTRCSIASRTRAAEYAFTCFTGTAVQKLALHACAGVCDSSLKLLAEGLIH